jgi:hypothetical protein
MDKWIKVSDKIPNSGELVLAYHTYDDHSIATNISSFPALNIKITGRSFVETTIHLF